MEAEYKFIELYTHNKQGELLITRGGNRYVQLLFGDGIDVVYESLFFTKKAYWKIELIFESFGVQAPPFEEFVSTNEEGEVELNTKPFMPLINKEIKAVKGTDKGGYPKLVKFIPKAIAKTETDESEVEEEDDVPF